MAKKMYKKSCAIDRRLSAYPNWKYYKMAIAYSAKHGIGKSTASVTIIQSFFDKTYNQREQQELIKLYDSMTEEEKQSPAKYWSNRDNKLSGNI